MAMELSASDLQWLHSLDLAISICTRMDELGISKTELADRAGMKLSSLSRIITGEQNMTLATIAKLEVALNIRFDEGFRYRGQQKEMISGSMYGETKLVASGGVRTRPLLKEQGSCSMHGSSSATLSNTSRSADKLAGSLGMAA